MSSNSSSTQWLLQDEDFNRFFNELAKNRKPSLLRKMSDYQSRAGPECISFAGGFPNPSLFPFKSASFTLLNDETIEFDQKLMEFSQQYGPTKGHPPFLVTAESIIQHYFNPPRMEDRLVSITTGNQEGFSSSIEMILSIGDYIIVEEPTFSGALSVMNPYKPKYLGIPGDESGMIPEKLEEALSKWTPEECRSRDHGVPKLIYINPSAANPSGVSLTTERKKQIYEIARNYNLIIIEDDPYYFLQFNNTKDFPKTFLSLDTDGRVIRLDSLSKTISSGFRVGFATGHKTLIGKLVQHSMATTMHPASISQVLVNELLTKWGLEGLEKQFEKVQKFYENQREFMIQAAKNNLSDLCEWNVPTGGMFLWVKVKDLKDTFKMCTERALARELLVMPGNAFMTDSTKPSPHLRLCFSLSSQQNIDEGCERLALLIKEEIELQKVTK